MAGVARNGLGVVLACAGMRGLSVRADGIRAGAADSAAADSVAVGSRDVEGRGLVTGADCFRWLALLLVAVQLAWLCAIGYCLAWLFG